MIMDTTTTAAVTGTDINTPRHSSSPPRTLRPHSVRCAALSPSLGQPPFRTLDFVELLGKSERSASRETRESKSVERQDAEAGEEGIRSGRLRVLRPWRPWCLGVHPSASVRWLCIAESMCVHKVVLSIDRPQRSVGPIDRVHRLVVPFGLTWRNFTKSKTRDVALGCIGFHTTGGAFALFAPL